MNLETTLAIFAAGAVLAVFANMMGRRKPPPGEVHLIPWTALQFVFVVVAVIMAGHLVTLLTGKPLTGRLGF